MSENISIQQQKKMIAMVHVKIDTAKLKKAMRGKRDEIAKDLNLHPNSISRKLSGKHAITLDELNQIADFLGMDATEFIIFHDAQAQWKVVRVA